MSRVICEECGEPIEREELTICKTCERVMCVECLAQHACTIAAIREVSGKSPEFNLREVYKVGYKSAGSGC